MTVDKLEIVIPAGTGGEGDYALSITPERAGWEHSSLNVLELAAGGTHTYRDRRERVGRPAAVRVVHGGV